MTENQARFARGPKETPDGKPILRMRDVIYWYLDYREFADVVKYRIAMMRKGIDEKVKQVSGGVLGQRTAATGGRESMGKIVAGGLSSLVLLKSGMCNERAEIGSVRTAMRVGVSIIGLAIAV